MARWSYNDFWRLTEELKYKCKDLQWILYKKMKFSIKDFFSYCDQISSFLRIWLHLLMKSLIENFIFCAVADYPYFDCLKTFKNVFRLRLSQCPKINLLKNRNEICEMGFQKWIYKIGNKIETDLQIFLM